MSIARRVAVSALRRNSGRCLSQKHLPVLCSPLLESVAHHISKGTTVSLEINAYGLTRGACSGCADVIWDEPFAFASDTAFCSDDCADNATAQRILATLPVSLLRSLRLLAEAD